MAKLFILLVFSVSTFAAEKSPLETFDLPPEERDAVIDYCAPTESEERILSDGTRQRKYLHPSESAGLTEGDEPPYDHIEGRVPYGNDPLSKKALVFLAFMADGKGLEYGCDRITVLYFAKFIKRYWPGQEFRNNNPRSSKIVDSFLKRRQQVPLLRNAIIEARRMLIKENSWFW